jgi:hypothetical protein
MQLLLIPGLVAILASVGLSFFVMPRVAPAILLTGSAVLFVLALYVHWSKFGRDEYERATFWWNMKDNIYMVLIGIIIVGCIIFYAMNHAASSTGSSIPALRGGYFGPSDMPPISVPAFGGGLEEIAMTAGSRIHNLFKKGRLTN